MFKFFDVIFKRHAIKVAFSEPSVRRGYQDIGVSIIPSNFYSTVPSLDEIENSFEYLEGAGNPYLDCDLFNNDLMVSELDSIGQFSKEFCPKFDGDEESCESFFGITVNFLIPMLWHITALFESTNQKKSLRLAQAFQP